MNEKRKLLLLAAMGLPISGTAFGSGGLSGSTQNNVNETCANSGPEGCSFSTTSATFANVPAGPVLQGSIPNPTGAIMAAGIATMMELGSTPGGAQAVNNTVTDITNEVIIAGGWVYQGVQSAVLWFGWNE